MFRNKRWYLVAEIIWIRISVTWFLSAEQKANTRKEERWWMLRPVERHPPNHLILVCIPLSHFFFFFNEWKSICCNSFSFWLFLVWFLFVLLLQICRRPCLFLFHCFTVYLILSYISPFCFFPTFKVSFCLFSLNSVFLCSNFSSVLVFYSLSFFSFLFPWL